MFKLNPMMLGDFYKMSHPDLYDRESGTIYATWTPRKSRIKGCNKVVVFGVQAFIQKWLIEYFEENFFKQDVDKIVNNYLRLMNNTIGSNGIGEKRIRDLHKLGYLPLEIRCLPEGTMCPIGVPMLTVENTIPEFYWITNFIESFMSSELWSGMTSATIAHKYKKILNHWADKTCDNRDHVDFQGHDFSFRGLNTVNASLATSAGHLLSFSGTDTVPAIPWLEYYYGANVEKELVATSISATEHSIMEFNSAGKENDEYDAFKRIIKDVHPKGIVSVVSDTWNLWEVLKNVLPRLKSDILLRDGKVVIRPDCYTEDTQILTENGWKLFKDITKNDKVAQYHENGDIDFTYPLKYINQHYEGEMYNFNNKNNNIDICVTPNHRMMQRNKKDKNIEVKYAEDITYINKDFICAGKKCGSVNSLTPLDRLMIAYQADGRTRIFNNKTNNTYLLEFQFAKDRKIERLKQICIDGNFKFKITAPKSRTNMPNNWHDQKSIYITIDLKPTKILSQWFDLKDKSYHWCREFIEEVSYWDATRRTDTRYKYDTTNVNNAEFVQLVAILAGYRTKFTKFIDNRSDKFNNIYTVNIITKRDCIDGKSVIKTKTYYNGNIYCVQVPTGMLVVRRNNQVAISGNSGDPCDIVCGLNTKTYFDPYRGIDKSVKLLTTEDNKYAEQINKGVVELLWDIFGGTINSKGYKVLDPHIGCIYGDAITMERANEICERLAKKGFASSNIVFGIGSYTYQYNTRDTFGFALKSTYAIKDGKEVFLFKDPITDSGEKKSQKGMVAVIPDGDTIKLVDHLTSKDRDELADKDLLQLVFKDGTPYNPTTLSEIRDRLLNQTSQKKLVSTL